VFEKRCLRENACKYVAVMIARRVVSVRNTFADVSVRIACDEDVCNASKDAFDKNVYKYV
jgi:hypothetical protein